MVACVFRSNLYIRYLVSSHQLSHLPVLHFAALSYVMRMKEYERERRLQLRKKRIEAQAEAA